MAGTVTNYCVTLIFMLNFDIMYILISKYYIMLVLFHQRIQKLKQSINSFFTILKRHNCGSHCTTKRGWNGIVTGKNSDGWMVEVYLYPDHLKENMPKIGPNSWVADQVKQKYTTTDHCPHAEEDVLNVVIGCTHSVIIYLCRF